MNEPPNSANMIDWRAHSGYNAVRQEYEKRYPTETIEDFSFSLFAGYAHYRAEAAFYRGCFFVALWGVAVLLFLFWSR